MCVQLCYWMDVVVVMEYEIFRGWGRGGGNWYNFTFIKERNKKFKINKKIKIETGISFKNFGNP